MSEAVLHWAQFAAFLFGSLAGLSTFIAIGLPVIGKYPHRFRHAVGEVFTGELQDKLESELGKATGDLRLEFRESNTSMVQAIHDMTTIMSDNHAEAMQSYQALEQRLHAHETDIRLHRREAT